MSKHGKTAEEKLAYLLSVDTPRRAEQAKKVADYTDLQAADEFLHGFMHMMGMDAIGGDVERIEALRATLACMIHDLRAGERVRMRRSS